MHLDCLNNCGNRPPCVPPPFVCVPAVPGRSFFPSFPFLPFFSASLRRPTCIEPTYVSPSRLWIDDPTLLVLSTSILSNSLTPPDGVIRKNAQQPSSHCELCLACSGLSLSSTPPLS